MKTAAADTAFRTKNILRVVLVTVLILLVPLVAMQFTDQVAWSLADYITAGVLLLGAGFSYEFVLKKVRSTRQRIILVVLLAGVYLLVWLELAVGIFGVPFSGS